MLEVLPGPKYGFVETTSTELILRTTLGSSSKNSLWPSLGSFTIWRVSPSFTVSKTSTSTTSTDPLPL